MLKLKSALFGLAVVLIAVALDVFLPLVFEQSLTIELVGDVLTGAVAGLLMFKYMTYRARLSQQRTAQIADLNHHIRNALDAIVLSHHTGDDVLRLEVVRDASNRIQYALNDFTDHDKHLIDKLPGIRRD